MRILGALLAALYPLAVSAAEQVSDFKADVHSTCLTKERGNTPAPASFPVGSRTSLALLECFTTAHFVLLSQKLHHLIPRDGNVMGLGASRVDPPKPYSAEQRTAAYISILTKVTLICPINFNKSNETS